jgi:hemin uptake protein HemP
MNRLATLFALLLASSLSSYGADSAVQVQLDASKASPRTVESLTAQVILRDYRFAWTSVSQSLEFNTLDPLEGAFAGEAKQWLRQTVSSQQRSGLSQRYVDQNHKVQAVFYAPEGDVIELHDTAEYQLQILDAGKLIHEERVVVHYIVLMTPAADRWVIRHLQAVPQF